MSRKKFFQYFISAICISTILLLLPSCKMAYGDGPDVATPRVKKEKSARQKSWINEQQQKEKARRGDLNTPGGNDDFQVFPTRSGGKRRSESLNDDFKPFFWE